MNIETEKTTGEYYIMAHELEIVDGNAQMAYVGDLPWHGLGTKV